MSYFIHLSLLLATSKMIVISTNGKQSDQETSLSLLEDQWDNNISCKNEKTVWKIQWKKNNRTLSLSCTGEEHSSGSSCLKIKIPSLGNNNHELCKQCCKTGNQCQGDCGGNCEESCTITGIADTLNVKIKDDCVIKINDIETGVHMKFFDEKKSWIKALQHCHNLSHSLVHITNQTVQKGVQGLLKNQSKLEDGVWVGLERSIFGTNLEWKWTSGSTAVNPKWTGNFPVDSLNNHCGKIIWNMTSETIKLVDANCHDKLPFICQANLI